ncbi:MarR family transcriptional regulator [Gordonia sp. PDNC005]|uniref:MarR family winged helix-turn-helix transcriptional regulator n=1 Tax=unclassified Gordonia (in: high G+C Gram-positive bacteria) TaxID=2657482 RepID=UPI0019652FBB|nr:MarR family transcriptional regulator [Gordonia sp. PDNC005]QRY63325.1 MarR family transcriptional regulator [Gordonia sp. PDNC005]
MNLAYELHDLVRTLDRQADDILRTQDLGYLRYVALIIVDEHPGISGRQLAHAVGVSDAASSGIVRKLEAAGLIHDVSPDGSGRVRNWTATPAGVALRTECDDLLGDGLGDAARRIGLDPEELTRTIHALHNAVRTPEDQK